MRSNERPNVEAAARDHLANERTYLAWVRTGLGTGALGLAVGKLLEDTSPRSWLAGLLFVLLGIALLLYGTMRYRRVQRGLEQGIVSIDETGPFAITVAAVAVASVAGVLLL